MTIQYMQDSVVSLEALGGWVVTEGKPLLSPVFRGEAWLLFEL